MTRLHGAALGLLLTACGADYEEAALPPTSQPSPTVPSLHDGWPAERWAALLADPDPAARAGALGALATMGLVAAAQADVVAARLGDPDPHVRWAAAEALGRMGPAAAPHATTLLALLDDSSPGVRRAAATAATRLDAACAVGLAQRLGREGDPARALVREALLALGPHAAPGAEAIATGLGSEEPDVVEDALTILAALGEAGAPHLGRALEDPRAWVAALAAQAIGGMGAQAGGLLPSLVHSLGRGGSVRRAALEALIALGGPGRQALEQAAHAPEGAVAEAARAGLEEWDRRVR